MEDDSRHPVVLRLAVEADAESIREIYNVEVTESRSTFDLVPRSAEDQRAWLTRHQGVHPAVVAVSGSEVVGFGSLSPYRDRPAYATSCEDSIYVRRDQRGRGIGRLLLEELLRIGGDHGFHAVMARIVGANAASVAVHEACGFTLVGTEREIGRKFGQWLDVVVLQRLL